MGLEMKRILIADSSEEFRASLQEYLQDTYLVKVCREGNEALQLMESFKPDVLILDMLLPGVDGMTVLQRAVDSGLRTTVLATIRFASDYMIDAMGRLGVGYVMRKPCELSAVAVRLEDMLSDESEEANEVTRPDLSTLVDNALREMSFQSYKHGYPVMREALAEAIRNPGQQVTKTLYPTVGKLYGCTGEQVEHIIRRNINQAWDYRDQAVWDRYFATRPGAAVTKCPSNKVFLEVAASIIVAENFERNVYSRKSG